MHRYQVKSLRINGCGRGMSHSHRVACSGRWLLLQLMMHPDASHTGQAAAWAASRTTCGAPLLIPRATTACLCERRRRRGTRHGLRSVMPTGGCENVPARAPLQRFVAAPACKSCESHERRARPVVTQTPCETGRLHNRRSPTAWASMLLQLSFKFVVSNLINLA